MLVWLAYTMTAVAGDGLNLHKRGFWPLPQSLLHQAALWNLLAVVILLINKFLVIGIWEAIYTYHTILVYCLPNILGHFCNEMWSLLSNLRHVLHSHIILESEILNILLLICSDNMNNWHRRGELGHGPFLSLWHLIIYLLLKIFPYHY